MEQIAENLENYNKEDQDNYKEPDFDEVVNEFE